MPRKQQREKGSGSVYKSRGKWWAQRERPAADDKRGYERRSFHSRSAAIAQISAWQAEASLSPPARDTVRAWCTAWVATKRAEVKPRTVEFYERHLGYTLPYLGDTRLTDLTPGDVRAMLTDLDEQLSDRSRAHIRTVLRASLQMAVADGILTRNPVDSVDAPRVTAYRAVALNDTERAALLNAASDRWYPLWLIAVDFGPRIGELLSARLTDYDPAARTLRIYASKTDRTRVLPLSPTHCAALDQHLERVDLYRLDERWHEHGYLFPSEVGTALGYHNVQRAFKALLDAADLPSHIRIHDLRHTAATNLLAAGNDVATVQAITGHTSTAVLLTIYAHTTTERQRAAIERVEQRRIS